MSNRLFGRTTQCVAFLFFALCSAGVAASPALGFTGGTPFVSFNGTDITIGWSFTVGPGAGITVDSLGWYDPTPADPLNSSHLVGIWNLSGVLLGSATVQTTGALTGSFRYATVTPFVLIAGTTYVIGGEIAAGNTDTYETSTSSVAVDPAIAFNGAARSDSSSGFAAPLTLSAGVNGRFGPNFDFTTNAVTSVPEPSPLWLGLAGLGMLGLMRMRRRGAPARFALGMGGA